MNHLVSPIKRSKSRANAVKERVPALSNQQELFALNTESDVTHSVVSQTQIEGQKHKVNVTSNFQK
jgi:hypothetical protein